jgi:type I restriction enzyme, S subunit
MTKYNLGDLVRNCKEKVDRDNNSYEYFVAGDHMETERPRLTMRGRFDEADVGPAFIRLFRPGQVLYGSRRTYLKKVSVADFEGVTSNVTFVLETKNEDVLPQRLLPFLLLSDRFTSYSIGKSKGSTNPYVLFSDLADFEVDLPGPARIAEIADVMCAAEQVKENYRSLLTTCDDVVKSQFAEAFNENNLPLAKVADLVTSMRNGLSPSKTGSHHARVLTLSAITQGSFDKDAWKDGAFTDEPPSDKRVTNTDFYVCRGNGNKSLVGAGEYSPEPIEDCVFPDTIIALTIDQDKALLPYLKWAWRTPFVHKQIEAAAKTTNGTYKINQTSLGNVVLPLAPLELQRKFADFAASVDKSKFAVQKALDELNATTKKILNQELGLGDV